MIEIIPAIDIIGGKCTRLSQGDYATQKNYGGDPTEWARAYADCGVRRLHLVDLEGAKEAAPKNLRTLEAVSALKAGDLERFGKLMNESHVSLRDDYDVTGPELDALAEEAWKCPGVIGSRMTGGGFGGCTVSIVEDDAVENFMKQVGEGYQKRIGYPASFYVVEIGGGPCRLD